MGAQDYLSAADTGQPLLGTPAPTPWDPQLSVAMSTAGRSVMEERLLPVLLADVKRESPWPRMPEPSRPELAAVDGLDDGHAGVAAQVGNIRDAHRAAGQERDEAVS